MQPLFGLSPATLPCLAGCRVWARRVSPAQLECCCGARLLAAALAVCRGDTGAAQAGQVVAGARCSGWATKAEAGPVTAMVKLWCGVFMLSPFGLVSPVGANGGGAAQTQFQVRELRSRGGDDVLLVTVRFCLTHTTATQHALLEVSLCCCYVCRCDQRAEPPFTAADGEARVGLNGQAACVCCAKRVLHV